MKIEREVKKCDRCEELYEVVLNNPDWKVTYLDEPYDLCGSCYNRIAPVLKSTKSRDASIIKDKK